MGGGEAYMAAPKGKPMITRPTTKQGPLTEDTPLNPIEYNFIKYYMETSMSVPSIKRALNEAGIVLDGYRKYEERARHVMARPNVRAEIKRMMNELRNEAIATAEEVMKYFTGVMRGEVKDQFGLDAPLSERTRAAQELAKRTIDIENRTNGKADTVIEVKLNWGE